MEKILTVIMIITAISSVTIGILILVVLMVNDDTKIKYDTELFPDTGRIPRGMKYDYFKLNLQQNYNKIKEIKHFKKTRFKEIKPILLEHKQYTTTEEEAEILNAMGFHTTQTLDGWLVYLP